MLLSSTRLPAAFGWSSLEMSTRCSTTLSTFKFTFILAITFYLACSQAYSRIEQQENSIRSSETLQNSAPFVYSRLRVDKYYLPLSERYLRKKPYDERQLELKLLDKEEPIKYYVNPTHNLDNVTENELILEALDQTYKIRLLQPFAQSFDKPGDREHSSDPKKVSTEKCSRDIDYLLDKLKSYQVQPAGFGASINPELATFFDAYSPEESGLLMGNFIWNGNWRQCSHRHIFDLNSAERAMGLNEAPVSSSDIISFTGRFCLASIRSPSWEESIKRKTREMSKAGYLEDAVQESQYRNYFRIQVGFCLPESCDSNLIFTQASDVHTLATFKLRETFKSYKLIDLFCLPDESSPMRQLSVSAWALVIVSIGWITLIGVATCLDFMEQQSRRAKKRQLVLDTGEDEGDDEQVERDEKNEEKFSNMSLPVRKVLISMSLFESYDSLVRMSSKRKKQVTQHGGQENGSLLAASGKAATPAEPAAKDLMFLNAIKVFIMPSIVFGHCGMLTMQANTIPLDFDSLPAIVYHLLVGSSFYVDYYFAITGFLATYCSFASRTVFRYKPAHWLYSIFHRYWRLMPGYLLLFWFSRSLFKFTSSGALWDYGTSNTSTRAVCQRESWLTPLTLTSNLHPLYEECIMPTWYISNDMQYYLITPPILVLLAKSPALGWLTLCAGMLANVLLRAHRFYTDPMVNPLALLRSRYDIIVRNQRDISDTYLLPHYRIGAYLLGLLAGHYAFMVRSGRWRSPLAGSGKSARRIRHLMLAIGLVLCILMNLASAIVDALLPTALDRYMRELATLLFSFDHLFGVLGPMLIILALALDAAPRLRKLMELPLWTYLSRINYFVFLYQIELIAWYVNSSDLRPGSTGASILQMFTFVMPQLYLLAAIATLLLANPLARLESEFVGAFFAKSSTKQHNNNNKLTSVASHEQPQDLKVLEAPSSPSSDRSHPLTCKQQQTLTTITATG